MFDERDLDHRMYGYKKPINLTKPGIRIDFAKHNKAIQEFLECTMSKLKDLCGKYTDLPSTE